MRLITGLAIVAASATAAHAGGIERTTQSAMILYEKGNVLQLSFGYAMLDVAGTDTQGNSTGDVATDFALPDISVKVDLSDKIAVAMIYNRPFGADVNYAGDSTTNLGGTSALAQTSALTGLLKYQFTPNISAFGGLRIQKAKGDITLSGLAYSTVSGYSVSLDDDTGVGYVVGAAYEIPEIALRVALTYNSAISYDLGTTESMSGTTVATGETTKVKTPESVNLEFQTGVSQTTLLTGAIRWVRHSEFQVEPAWFYDATGGGLVNLDDTTTYTLGLGHRFAPKLAGSISLAYEAPGDMLVSPLAPSNGRTTLAAGMAYDVNEKVQVAGGIAYSWVGDADAQTGGNARAYFRDSTATALGMKVTYRF